MADIALEMNGVSKKFRKGETYDCLRDLIPALVRRGLKTDAHVTLGEREFWALSDISFQVRKGEAFGIIGGNGAGKSTMLKLLSGILRPTKGTMRVKGRLSALIEVGAGFHPDLTGRENISLNGAIMGMSREEVRRKFAEIVEFSGLEEFIDTPVKRYSSGMYARLGFSVAAHVEPDILIVDEVLSVGDFYFQQKCTEKMAAIMRGGATVIFVSHNLRAVSELCHRSLLLERGRVVKEGNTGEIVGEYMSRSAGQSLSNEQKEVYVSKAGIRNEAGETVNFRSGERAFLDIEVTANKKCEKLAIVVAAQDENFYLVSDTSTERLGMGNFTLDEGEVCTCTFELDLNFGRGTFHFAVYVYRYDIQKEYDKLFPAATVFVSNEIDVRGAVNVNPRVLQMAVRKSK
jgi:lipopolysaccharide transport system ATP-binding protein